MARRWKIAAWMVVWLGVAWLLPARPVQAQTPPPPVPIGPSGGVYAVPVFPGGQPMPPGGPMQPWAPPMPGPGGAGPRPPMAGPGGMPGGPGGPPGAPPGMARGMMPPPGHGEPEGDKGALDLDVRAIKNNAFSGEEGFHYIPLTHQFSVEYLTMWFKSHRLPPLVTIGDPADPDAGILGAASTVVVHGDRRGAGPSNALRVNHTWWLCDPETVSLDSSFFIMEQRSLFFAAASDENGGPLIARPFFNASFGTEDADIRSNPLEKAGSVSDTFMTRLMGAEANLKCNLSGAPCSSGPTLNLLTGIRWIRLDEKYFNRDTSDDIIAAGESRVFTDNITCYNEFVGGQLGGQMRCRWDRLTIDLITKIAVGQNFQTVRLKGTTTIRDDVTGDAVTTGEGLYVQASNRGEHRREHITVVPEVNLNFGVQLNDNCRLSVGYGVFSMNNMLRPGNLINRNIELQPAGIPTTQPGTDFRTTDFWAQWVNFGVEFSF